MKKTKASSHSHLYLTISLILLLFVLGVVKFSLLKKKHQGSSQAVVTDSKQIKDSKEVVDGYQRVLIKQFLDDVVSQSSELQTLSQLNQIKKVSFHTTRDNNEIWLVDFVNETQDPIHKIILYKEGKILNLQQGITWEGGEDVYYNGGPSCILDEVSSWMGDEKLVYSLENCGQNTEKIVSIADTKTMKLVVLDPKIRQYQQFIAGLSYPKEGNLYAISSPLISFSPDGVDTSGLPTGAHADWTYMPSNLIDVMKEQKRLTINVDSGKIVNILDYEALSMKK